MSKALYERLARTPKVNPRAVERLREAGLSLEQIVTHFGPPTEPTTSYPFLTPSCPGYPEGLRRLADPPLRLFTQGKPLEGLPLPVVAVVGSRKASPFGLRFAQELGASIARRGLSVCSGLALGIDAAAHRGVLEELSRNTQAGPPIAVLGHGWGNIYPSANRELAKAVLQNGSLVTEFSPGTPPAKWTFPARNRVIAALSQHVVIVEASARSGSLSTARHALDLGCSVWIVPNAPGRPNSAGVLSLWKDGADIITDIDEFLNEIAPLRTPSKDAELSNLELSPENLKVLECLARHEGDLGALCEELRFSATEIAYRLTELELENVLRRSLNGRWEIVRWDLLSHLR